MTTPWQPNQEWTGGTAAIFASGPSMSAEVAEALRHHFCIAVNYSCRLAPWADMLIALDGNWDDELRAFKGMRVTGVEDESLDAFYIGPQWERVQLAPNHQVEIHNSGLSAIRLAARMGATKIILCGFEPETRRHFYDDEVDTGEYFGLAEGIKQLTAALAAQGVTVEKYAPVAKKAPRV